MEQDKPVILLADDEPLVRNFVRFALTKHGYHVLAASDGVEALQISRGYDGPIDLLLSDVKMPRMTGPQLAEVMKRERPDTRVLLISGHSSGSIPDYLRAELLRKPFLARVLIKRIEQALQSGPSDEPHVTGPES